MTRKRRKAGDRPGFTLVEVLVVVAIVAAMVTVSVASVRAGQGAARVRGAARDVLAVIRHARSVALVSQEPSIVTYECRTVDGVARSAVRVYSSRLLVTKGRGTPETLSGEPLKRPRDAASDEAVSGESPEGESGSGGIVEEVLFAPISEDVLTDIRIRVATGDEALESEDDESKRRRANRISVFSNIDYRLGKFDDWKRRQEEAERSGDGGAAAPAAGRGDQELVKVQWETNGRCDPHRVWIYRDGASPESGLLVKIDRFGAASVVTPDEDAAK